MAGKKLLLMQELLVEASHPDKLLFQDLVSGIKLTGHPPASGVFAPGLLPQDIAEAELRRTAAWTRRATLSNTNQGTT